MAANSFTPKSVRLLADDSAISEAQASDQRKRDAMNVGLLRLPCIQYMLTWMTILPHSQQTLRHHRRSENFVSALVAGAIAMVLCHEALGGLQPWPVIAVLLFLGWGHAVFSLRCLALPNRHAAAHGNLTGHRVLDQSIGQVISALLGSASMSAYTATHVSGHHHWRKLGTPGENWFEELRSLGFVSGCEPARNWSHLIKLLCNPFFYVNKLYFAIQTVFFSGRMNERIFNAIFWVATIQILVVTAELRLFLFGFLPARLLAEIPQVLRTLVEHRLPAGGNPRIRSAQATMTIDVVCGEPSPANEGDRLKNALQWLAWGARMSLLHLPVRFWVLTGDASAHSCHHWVANADFANAIAVRQDLIEKGYPITSVWGLGAAIDGLFKSLEAQPPGLLPVD